MPTLEINGNKYTPELILFDVDGTLVDDQNRYSNLGKARYQAFMDHVSVEAAEKWAQLAGVDTETWKVDPKGPISKAPRRDDLAIAAAALYLERYNWYDARSLAEELYSVADELQAISYVPKFFKGVKKKLIELNEAGFLLGLATNGVTDITERMIGQLGVADLFWVVVGADKVEKSKPAPDMIIFACNSLEVQVSETVYVGDQPTDMEAAKNAGVLAAVGVNNIDLEGKDADEVTSSVSDFRVIRES